MEGDKKLSSKKRAKGMDLDDNIEDDYYIHLDGDNSHINKQLGKDGVIAKEEEIVDVEFLFSEIRDTYFFGIKNFLEGMLDFDTFNSSELADNILKEKDFLGNVIKTELEEESGNSLPDLYALATLVPFQFFNNSESLKQIADFACRNIKNAADKAEIDKNSAEQAITMLLNSFDINSGVKLGLLVNERVNNLPHQLVFPLLNCINDDIAGYKDVNDNNPKYDCSHILYITK